MNAGQAHAVRRAAAVALALAATLAAHGSSGGVQTHRAAPVSWGLLVVLSVLAGRRRRTFTARGPLRAIATMLVAQAALHIAMSAAPWAFGLEVHHAASPQSALVAHAVAAIVLGLCLSGGERLLAAAVALGRRLGRVFDRRSATGPAPYTRCAVPRFAVPRALTRPAHQVRGPPRVAVI